MKNAIEIRLGALAESIETQLNKQGYTLGENISKYEKLDYARTMLFLHGYLTDRENDRISGKICKSIFKDIKPM